jgi:tripartite-type tricarboxylate transporter receptor subunit TctC
MERKVSRVVAAIGLMVAVGCAAAQGYPAKTVRVIVPSSPGDGADILARAMSTKLSEAMRQPFVVENRPGAGGVVGSEMVAKSAPDATC